MLFRSKAIIEKLATIAFEQLMPLDRFSAELREKVLSVEANRECVEPWIDAVLQEIDYAERLVFIARTRFDIVAYMILKPRDHKISSIWVDPDYRSCGIGAKFYGMGVVNLGVSAPFTAFMPEMLNEMRPLARTYSLTIDDLCSPCILNPDARDPWSKATEIEAAKATRAENGAEKKPVALPEIAKQPASAVHTKIQATRLVRDKISSYQA